LDDPDVDGKIILKLIFREWNGGLMDYINLDQDRDRWQALVNTVMNLQVPQNTGNFLTSCDLVSFSRRTLFLGVSI
jgi:hypothetical protein